MLLLTESCDFDLSRWNVNGEVSLVDGIGINQKSGILIPSSNSILKNRMSKQFRAVNNDDEKRDFRLSFWFKVNGQIAESSEFISIKSVKQNCGAMIGINKLGQLYATNLYAPDIPGYHYTKDNDANLRLNNGKYHYVEIYAKYDADWTGCIKIFVNNVLYLHQEGMNLLEDYCWSRPDSITFGNLIGTDLHLDDIILWDDLGSDYIGMKGSTILSSKQLLETSEELYGTGTKTFDINNQNSLGSMVTMAVSATEAQEATIKSITVCNGTKTEGKEYPIFTTNDTSVSIFAAGKENMKVGIERVS